MQNYFKIIKDCHPNLQLYSDESDLLKVSALFLAYAHIRQNVDISKYRDLYNIFDLLGLDESRLEKSYLRSYEYLSDELLDKLSLAMQEDDVVKEPGRFVAEVLQMVCLSNRKGAWNGASFSLLEAMFGWTKDASRIVVMDHLPSPLIGIVANGYVPVDWYVPSGTAASLANVVSRFIGLNVQVHPFHYNETNISSKQLKQGTGWVEFFPLGFKSEYSRIDSLVDDVPGPMAVVLPLGMRFAANLISSRKKILESGRLYAIVSFPSGMLTLTGIPVDLYLFSPKGSCPNENVRMVSLESEHYWENRPSRRGVRSFTDAGSEMIQNVLGSGKLCEGEALVPIADLLKSKNACLSIERYVMRPEVVASRVMLKRFPRKLTDVVEIVRPVPVRHAEESGDEYREVGSADINDIGVIESAGRQVFVVPEKISKGFENMVLRDDDIVFYIKGNVGTCGLVKNAESNWICGQSAVILRLRNDVNGMSPEILIRYLRSETVSNYLSTLVSGTTVRFIAVKTVENLPVPVLTDTEIKFQKRQFQEQLSLMSEIEKLKNQIQALSLKTLSEKWAEA